MNCLFCKDRELDSRCPECNRLPKEPQLAILSEVYDIINYLDNQTKIGFEVEIFRAIKILTGVTTKLIKDTRRLRAPYGTRKGIPKHAPSCSIHEIPHDHCDCVVNRQPNI